MRIMVTSDEGGKPFELFTAEDNGLDKPGWYYQLMQPACDPDTGEPYGPGVWEVLDLDGPEGPFSSLNEAFCDAIASNYDIDPINAMPAAWPMSMAHATD